MLNTQVDMLVYTMKTRSHEVVLKAIEQYLEDREIEKRISILTDHLCIECNKKTYIHPINICKKANPTGWKSYYECENEHIEYRKESVRELLK